MDMSAGIGREQAQLQTGCMLRPGWSTLYPDLRQLLEGLYAQVAQLPFVPASWLATVKAYHAANQLCDMIPARLPGGMLRPGMPEWLNNPAAAEAWDKVEARIQASMLTWSNGNRESAHAELAAFERNKAFWDGIRNPLITAATAVRDLPANAVKAVLGGVGDVAGGVLKSLFGSWVVWVALGLGGLGLAWKLGAFRSRK